MRQRLATLVGRLAATRNLSRSYPVYILLGGLIAVGIYLGFRPGGGAAKLIPQPIKMDPSVELQFQGVTMQGMDKGTRRWVIDAPKVTASQNQQVVNFEDPQGTFLNLQDLDSATVSTEPQHHTVTWTAKQAQYDSFQDAMTITGNAVFTTDRKDVLKSNEVIFRTREHLVDIPSPLTLAGHDQTQVEADRATADTTLQTLDLHGHVQLTEPVGSQSVADVPGGGNGP